MPSGFRYRPELIDAHEAASLLREIASLPMKPYEFRGFLANRQVTAFGLRYNTQTRRLTTSMFEGVIGRARDLVLAARPG